MKKQVRRPVEPLSVPLRKQIAKEAALDLFWWVCAIVIMLIGIGLVFWLGGVR